MSRASPARRYTGHGAPPPPQPSPESLLPPVSLLDCLVFCVFLAPQLLVQAGPWGTFACIAQALPFLVLTMPVDVAHRQWTARRGRTTAPSIFEDVVLCCVRWAFVHMEPRVGRVFFSRPVALPFYQFRQLRRAGVWHTFRGAVVYVISFVASLLPTSFSAAPAYNLHTPAIRWREHHGKHPNGLWVTYDECQPPDIVIFFVHGGGFVLGSSHFYLEFLLAWAALLMEDGPGDNKARFHNPAIFSLDYTLAPDAVFPAQLDEATHAFRHVVSTAAQNTSTRVVAAGDSAGGAIILSLLLKITQSTDKAATMPLLPRMPDQVVLISPWVSLWSRRYRRSANDYIDAASLARYAAQYAGGAATGLASAPKRVDPILSPGHCQDGDWWRRACPPAGMLVTYGEEEVFAPEIRAWAENLQAAGVAVKTRVDAGGGLGVHAWPVASLFLARSNARRFEGLRRIVEAIEGGERLDSQ